MNDELKLDEVGEWTEIKIDIIKMYAATYSKILSANNFHHYYIDAFAGAGEHISRTTGQKIAGSPQVALNVVPPFREYHLIDLNKAKTDNLQTLVGSRQNVYIYNDDCNEVMLNRIIPHVKYADYKRALCILDPYGLHLSWEVIKQTGTMKTFDIFLHFPVTDMNRNILWRNPTGVSSKQIERMDFFWGDRSWKDAAYDEQPGLFENINIKKTNEAIVTAFKNRLKAEAGFEYVPEPLPMRISNGNVLYYLFFASQKPVAKKIVLDIFNKARSGKYCVS